MSHVLHDLHDAFPNDGAALHDLKTGNAHFNTLAERYHVLNREIHRIDSGIDAVAAEHAEQLKRQRLALLDEIGSMITLARVG